MDEKLLSILCEINNRLSDIAISLQVIGLMNASLDHREDAYKFLCDFLDVQKIKYRDKKHLTEPYNNLTGRYDT